MLRNSLRQEMLSLTELIFSRSRSIVLIEFCLNYKNMLKIEKEMTVLDIFVIKNLVHIF